MARNKPLKGILNAASPIKFSGPKGFYDQQRPFGDIDMNIAKDIFTTEQDLPLIKPDYPSNKDQIIKPAEGFGGKAIASLGLSPTTKDIRQRVYKKYKK